MPPKIKETGPIEISKLEIGTAQVRTSSTEKGIPELAESIKIMGQLQPIVVSPATRPGYFEILTGQRRFLACQILGKSHIDAVILEERVPDWQAKSISLTENLMREGLTTKEKVDACTALYAQYGNLQSVVEATGLSHQDVSRYTKFPRLTDELKEMVTNQQIKIDTALRAMDAATRNGKVNTTEAVILAKELDPMSGANQRNVVKEIERGDISASEAVEQAKSGRKLITFSITISEDTQSNIRAYAEDEGLTREEAGANLIIDQLSSLGYDD